MKIPDKLNGYDVIAALAVNGNQNEFVVIVRLDGNEKTPFVTARWHERCGTTWNLGHYVKTYDAAVASMKERAS